MKLRPNITIDELLKLYPATIPIFLRRKMLCIGCPTEKFHTIEEAARNNGMPLEGLMNELQRAIVDENQELK